MTKLDVAPTKTQIPPEEIQTMWESVDKKTLVQYKMKVDLGPDVMAVINQSFTGALDADG